MSGISVIYPTGVESAFNCFARMVEAPGYFSNKYFEIYVVV
jgi:hypothetical protein